MKLEQGKFTKRCVGLRRPCEITNELKRELFFKHHPLTYDVTKFGEIKKKESELDKSLQVAAEKEFWEPTMLLRWKEKVVLGIVFHQEKTLQQQWTSGRGNFEWRDIEHE